jgi:hypothetical protein
VLPYFVPLQLDALSEGVAGAPCEPRIVAGGDEHGPSQVMLIELGSKLVQGTVAEHDPAGQAGSRAAQAAAQAPAGITGGASAGRPAEQPQIDALQQQIRDLQRATTMDAAPEPPAAVAARASRPAGQPI